MDLVVKSVNALGDLLLCFATFSFASAESAVKHRSIPGIVLSLSLGAASAALLVLDLLGRMPLEWAAVCRSAVFGIAMICVSVWGLYSPPSPSFPTWTKWAILVLGVGSVVVALPLSLHHY